LHDPVLGAVAASFKRARRLNPIRGGIMLRENTNAGMLGQLMRFSAALAANSTELEHLEGMRLRLQRLVEEAQEIAQEQAALTASKQAATNRFQDLLSEGLRSATGLERMLLEFYGPGAEKLVEFGIQPLRGRRRSRATPEEPEAPGPEVESARPETLEDQTVEVLPS
jgi:hypothetical protein